MAEKTSKVSNNLIRILFNTIKRRKLASVVYPILLHGELIRANTMTVSGWKNIVKVQRRMVLRRAMTYRIVSADVAQVLTATPFMDLIVYKRKTVY